MKAYFGSLLIFLVAIALLHPGAKSSLRTALSGASSETDINVDLGGEIEANQDKGSSSLKAELNTETFSADRYCRRPAKGKVKQQASSKIYKWVDAQGKTHFGDSPHGRTGPVETIDLDAGKDYFDLAIRTKNAVLPPDFRSDLDIHIRKTYDIMSSLLPAEQLQKVAVNLWVFDKESQYQEFHDRYAGPSSAKSLGFHSSRENIAAAQNRHGPEQLLSTSLHEAVHVMNAGMFGWTERWLNEGMAEYFEHIKVYGQTGEVQVVPRSLRTIAKTKLDFAFLVQADGEDWQGEFRQPLYAYSWGWVFFLMQEPDTQSLLIDYLSSTARSPCEVSDSYAFFQQQYPGGVAKLQQNFDRWQSSSQFNHLY